MPYGENIQNDSPGYWKNTKNEKRYIKRAVILSIHN